MAGRGSTLDLLDAAFQRADLAAVAFSLWVMVLAAAFLLADTEPGKSLTFRTAARTVLKSGVGSGLVILLGSLFIEFWPVTVSMACLFAIGRSFKGDDGMAYN